MQHCATCSVYGKMGLWEQAVKVLTLMKSEVGGSLFHLTRL